jgi:hypothetical protein
MKNKSICILMLIGFTGLLLVSCAAIAQDMVESDVDGLADKSGQSQSEAPLLFADDDQAVIYYTAGSADLTAAQQGERLIVKNAEMSLLVKNTDTAVDQITQIIEDVGGYIISSRLWYQEWGDDLHKYSTFTIGVPTNQFESALSLLRDIAILVSDETTTGKDVTDKFVDIQPRLYNLEATRDQIRGFLDQTKSVEEALKINEELSKIEDRIEEIQGRIIYPSDRAAYSTITITIEPELKELPTSTSRPTRTPTPWSTSETYGKAKLALTLAYRGIVGFFIWLVVVVIPVLGPFALIGWLLWKYKKPKRRKYY